MVDFVFAATAKRKGHAPSKVPNLSGTIVCMSRSIVLQSPTGEQLPTKYRLQGMVV